MTVTGKFLPESQGS